VALTGVELLGFVTPRPTALLLETLIFALEGSTPSEMIGAALVRSLFNSARARSLWILFAYRFNDGGVEGTVEVLLHESTSGVGRWGGRTAFASFVVGHRLGWSATVPKFGNTEAKAILDVLFCAASPAKLLVPTTLTLVRHHFCASSGKVSVSLVDEARGNRLVVNDLAQGIVRRVVNVVGGALNGFGEENLAQEVKALEAVKRRQSIGLKDVVDQAFDFVVKVVALGAVAAVD